MKISDLSRESETPIPTIKFYIRRGLLPPGQSVARNQAVYGEVHLERLDLISRLKKYAGLSIDTIASVLDASDEQPDRLTAMDAGMEATGMHKLESGSPGVGLADSPGHQLVRSLLVKKKWPLRESDPAVLALAQAFDLVSEGWPFEVPAERVEKYIDAIIELAELEIQDDWSKGMGPDGVLKFALLGTYIFEPLILALRRAAHRARMLETLGEKQNKDSNAATG